MVCIFPYSLRMRKNANQKTPYLAKNTVLRIFSRIGFFITFFVVFQNGLKKFGTKNFLLLGLWGHFYPYDITKLPRIENNFHLGI